MERLIMEEPCGECDCGIYNELALLNKKSRAFSALDENERISHIPNCKKDNTKGCAGYFDLHQFIKKIDEYQEKLKEKVNEAKKKDNI